MGNTLFDTAEFAIQPRSLDGSYCTVRTKKAIDRLRTCIVGEVRRRDLFWKQLRQRDEEILELKAKLRKFAEQDKLSNKF